jgi:hypothetical protein
MTAHTLPHPSRSRALIGLLLALLVQGSWLLLLQLDRHRNKPAAPSLTALRILAAPAAPESKHARPAASRPALARSLASPWPEASAVVPTTVAPAAPTTAATAAAPEPLKLGLPPEHPASGPRPESMLSRMLNDPRARSAKRSVEFAVADAAGTLPISTQSSTDGTNSTLVRQGSKCIRVAEARIKTLNPMDDNARATPSVVGPCVKD